MKIKQFYSLLSSTSLPWAGRLLVLLALAVILWPQSVAGQHPAVQKLTLAQVEQLVSSKVPDSTLSAQIQSRGLAFAPSAATIESLRGKGAGPQTLAAIEARISKSAPSAQHATTSRTQRTLGNGFYSPASIAVDGSGNVYVVDLGAPGKGTSVKMILAVGDYNTVKTLGSDFYATYGVAVDGSGNVFIAETGRGVLREILAEGGYTTVNTLDISGSNGTPSVVAVDGSGNVFFANSGGQVDVVKEIPPDCASTYCVKTLGGGFKHAGGVAIDRSGNVFVADSGDNAVKKIPPGCASASCVRTLGGGFKYPSGIAVDGSGNVFVADRGNNAIKDIPLGCESASCVRTLGSDFNSPGGVAVDRRGHIFVADMDNHRVVELDIAVAKADHRAETKPIDSGSSLAETMQYIQDKLNGLGTVSYTMSLLNTSNGRTESLTVKLEFSNVVADHNQCRLSMHVRDIADGGEGDKAFSLRSNVRDIVAMPMTDTLAYIGGTPNVGNVSTNPPMTALVLRFHDNSQMPLLLPFTDAALANRVGEAMRHAVKLCSGDATNPTPSTQHAATGRTQRTLGSGFNRPSGIAVDGSGNVIITEPSDPNTPLQEILAEGGYTSILTVCTGRSIWGMAVDVTGHIFLAGPGFDRINEIQVAGCTTVKSLPSTEGFSVAVAVDGSGNVFLADNGIPRDNIPGSVKEIPSGCASANCVKTLGGGFRQPRGVAVDGSGNVFVVDTENNAVKEILPSCASAYCVKTLGGGFSNPQGVAVDGGGNVFVADTGNNAVKEIPTGCESASCVTTLGSDFKYPNGIAVDRSGNVFVADSGNNRVVELENAGTKSGVGGSIESAANAKVVRKLVISADVMSGMVLEKTAPDYPPIAKAARQSGTVVLQATISKTGTIENLRVVSGPPMLQQAALDTVKTWRYRPYLLNGEPVEVETTVNVIFALGG